jgi:hypothetical protein
MPPAGAAFRYFPSDCSFSKRRAEQRNAFRRSLRRGIFPHAGLSPQSGFGGNVLLHGEPARPPVGPVDDADRRVARRDWESPRPHCVPHRRLGRPSRPDALPVDPRLSPRSSPWAEGLRGRLLPEGDADFPGRWRAIKIVFSKSLPIAEPRSPVMSRHGERGVRQRRHREHTIRELPPAPLHSLDEKLT